MTSERWGMAILVLATAFDAGPAQEAVAKAPPIKDIMHKAHKGTKEAPSHLTLVKEELGKADPDWAVLARHSKALIQYAQYLGQNTPPRGDQAAWRQVTEKYVATVTELAAAADKQDRATARQLIGKLDGCTNCRACHMAHK